jgi:ABC-type dipeptide/oligopeptide/nickel transport system permease component
VSYLRAVQRHTPEGTGNVKIYLTSLSGSDSDAIYSYYHLILHDASGTGKSFYRERTLPEVMANIEAKYHLNDPIMTQYFNYLKQLAHGDFGPSFKYKDYSVNDLVAASFPVSAKLGFAAFLLAVVIGVAAGVIAALKQNTRWDYAVMGVAMTGVVIPSFVVAPLLVMILPLPCTGCRAAAGTAER